MSQFTKAPEWKDDETVSASKLNDGTIPAVRSVTVGPGLIAFRIDAQVALSLSPGRNPPAHILRAKVTRDASPGNPDVYGVTLWDGTNTFGYEVAARMVLPHSVGDDVIVVRPFGGTSRTDQTTGLPVDWLEIGFTSPYLVQIAGYVSGAAGKYTGGHIAPPAGDFPVTGDLVANHLGGVVSGATAAPNFLIVNITETRRTNHAHVLAKDSIWVANDLRQNADGTLVAYIQAGPAAWVPFLVDLAPNAGTDGPDASTRASWTYNVTAKNGEALGTNLSPEKPRELAGNTARALTGLAYYTDAGVLVLAEAWESFGSYDCNAGGG